MRKYQYPLKFKEKVNIYLKYMFYHNGSDNQHSNYNLKLQMPIIITINEFFLSYLNRFLFPSFSRQLYAVSMEIQNRLKLLSPALCLTVVCNL